MLASGVVWTLSRVSEDLIVDVVISLLVDTVV